MAAVQAALSCGAQSSPTAPHVATRALLRRCAPPCTSRARRSVVRAAAEGVVELPELTTAYWRWREHDIRYTRAGTHGPAVLCVHGFGGNCDHWRKNVAQLAANGFRCFAIDLLGFGYSSKPPPGGQGDSAPNTVYNFETWGEQLSDFAQELCLGPAFLVANSVGGIAALQAAVTTPALVRGVVLLDVSLRGLHVSKQPPLARPLIAAFQRLLRTSALGQAFFMNIAQPSTVRTVLREAYGDSSAVTDELVSLILEPGKRPGAAAVFLDFISYSSGPLAEDLLKRVTCPVLTVWGERDPWESVQLARQLYSPEAFPGVVERFVTLPGVGHCPQDESPQKVNPLVAEFVTRHSGADALRQV